MMRFNLGVVLLALTLASAPGLRAQEPAGSESLTAWQWYADVLLPEAGPSRYCDFLVSPAVFDRARQDLADLRLYDGAGAEVPYALRVLRADDRQQALQAREFNRANPDRTAEVSLDLGEGAVEHNEIVIDSPGSNFRRGVRLEGSDDSRSWRPLLDRAYIAHYEIEGKVIDVRRLRYPPSRFRYLRVQVQPDTGNKDDAPTIRSVSVYRSVHLPGEYVTLPAGLSARDAVKAEGGPGSAWILNLGGAVPCERLSFEVAEDDFVRSYYLEVLEDEGPPRFVAAGEWRRRAGAERRPLEIRFPELIARRLKLTVTDQRNPPLTVTAASYTAAARQVVFARPERPAAPYRLYFGNPKAAAPGYDFAKNLPEVLQPPPSRGRVATGEGGAAQNPDAGAVPNPAYQPVPKPWTERWPWLVYVVLASATLVLLLILGQLAREAIARHDAQERTAATP
jgi:hypothetical protein